MASRWDYILDQKPKAAVEHLLDEVAKLLAKDLKAFPPPIDGFEQAAAEERFRPLFEEPRARPADDVYRVSFSLARMELRREIEAIDDFMRNQRYLSFAPSKRDYLAMIFVSRWLTEQMLSLSEAVHSRVPRHKLVECLERAERLLLGSIALA